MGEEGGPLRVEVEEVRLAHPAWHLRKLKFRVRRAFDRIHADTLLAGVAPLFLHGATRDGSRRHHQDEELHRIDRIRDLFPEANAALKKQPVLLNDDVGSLASQPLPEFSRTGCFLRAALASGN